MKKHLYASLLTVSFLFAATASKAQLFIGVGASLNQYKTLGLVPGLQARFGVEVDDGRYTLNAGFNLGLAEKTTNISVPYTSTGTVPGTTDVPYSQRISVNSLFLHSHYNLGNDEQDFRMGLILGMSFDEYSVKYDAGTTPGGYTAPSPNPFENFTTTQINGDVGIKSNYRLGKGAVYAEAVVGIPINLNSQKELEQIGAGLRYGVQVGYKFHLGNARYVYRRRW